MHPELPDTSVCALETTSVLYEVRSRRLQHLQSRTLKANDESGHREPSSSERTAFIDGSISLEPRFPDGV